MASYPGTSSHAGISVLHLKKAVEFYSAVMGRRLIVKLTVVTEAPDTAMA